MFSEEVLCASVPLLHCSRVRFFTHTNRSRSDKLHHYHEYNHIHHQHNRQRDEISLLHLHHLNSLIDVTTTWLSNRRLPIQHFDSHDDSLRDSSGSPRSSDGSIHEAKNQVKL